MELKQYEYVSPLLNRYLPSDEEFYAWLRGNDVPSVISGIERVVPEIIIPRSVSLDTELLNIVTENFHKPISRRVDGQVVGMITIGELFTGYSKRFEFGMQLLKDYPLNLEPMEQGFQNDRLYYLTSLLMGLFGVEADIANDARHHFRTEIAEFAHKTWEKYRVGSSTMPHKINPAEYERIVSLHKEFSSWLLSAKMSQINEHQEDSTNDYMPSLVFGTACAVGYVTKYLENALKNLEFKVHKLSKI
ncbi:MAG: hypothetical protein AABX59_01190 [Nanoarchaeota archaeon]